MPQASAVVQASKNDGPSQQSLSASDLVFASKHTRPVVKAMKPRIASALALNTNPPVNVVAPVITGTGTVGSTLTLQSIGSWIGNTSGSYKWRRDGVDIAGATANTYKLVAADSTHGVTAYVTTTNKYGSTSATSNAIAVT